jgi:regulator of cell morphogenesis and NO signaling
MSDLPLQTLAEIVSKNYHTAAVFEKYHLDFCCKGRRSLQEACVQKQLNIQDILPELEQAMLKKDRSSVDFSQLTLTALADHIVTHHHQYIRKEMPLIMMYLQKIAAKHGERHPEMMNVFELFSRLKHELESHMLKEEQVLFPRIGQLEALEQEEPDPHTTHTFLEAPIRVMLQEHDDAGTIMAEIRAFTNDYDLPDDACTTYKLCFAALQAFEADLHQHVHLENNILFPKVLKLLNIPVSS